MAGRECLICMLPYEFKTALSSERARHPVTLRCGHPVCRGCLATISRIKRECPTCRNAFEGDVEAMPMTFGIKYIMEADEEGATLAPKISTGQILQNTAATVAAAASSAAAAAAVLKLSTQDAQAEKSRELRWAQKQAADLQKQAAQSQKEDAESQKQAQKQAEASRKQDALMWRQADAVLKKRQAAQDKLARLNNGHVNWHQKLGNLFTDHCMTPTAIKLKSSNYEGLLRLANCSQRNTVLDLCGREFYYMGYGGHTIKGSNITLRNGTINLAPGPGGPSLCVQGSGVVIEGVTICGGRVGLWVKPGGGVNLKGCQIHGAQIGIWVGSARIHADCTSQQASPPAQDSNGEQGCGDAGRHGSRVRKDSPGRLKATDVTCFGNAGVGVVVYPGSRVVMTDSSVKDNKGGSVLVRGKGSKVQLQSCEMDVKGVAVEGGVLQVSPGGWMKQLLGCGC